MVKSQFSLEDARNGCSRGIREDNAIAAAAAVRMSVKSDIAARRRREVLLVTARQIVEEMEPDRSRQLPSGLCLNLFWTIWSWFGRGL